MELDEERLKELKENCDAIWDRLEKELWIKKNSEISSLIKVPPYPGLGKKN